MTRANPDRQLVLEGGRTVTLRFSIKAMMALQDHYGLPSITAVGERLNGLGGDISGDDLVAMLWAGMRTHHPEIGMDEALDILDEVGLAAMMETIGSAFDAATGEGSGPAKGAADPTKSGRSKRR